MKNDYPKHIAIVMDGNGRWAQNMNKARIFGHREGSKVARKIVYWANKLNIKHLTLYTFSKENWNRPKHEVNALMSLLIEALNKGINDLLDNDIRLSIIGDLHQMPPKIVKSIEEFITKSSLCKGMTVHLALNYSSHWEIVEATKKIANQVLQSELKPDDIDEECFAKNLSNSGVPYPDLFIRTGGEYRISNFLLWQIAYTELYFTKTLWPNFTQEEFIEIIHNYKKRERRFGLISSQL